MVLNTPFSRRLAGAGKILFAGCGGGFDVYSGIPLALSAVQNGAKVAFANLSFSDLVGMDTLRIGPAGHVITSDLEGRGYFPELHLKAWLDERNIRANVYGLEKTGVVPLRATYRAIIDMERPDAIVLIDGGTDSVMKGDEDNLGTIVEDALSIVALSGIDHPSKSLACLGFGVDQHHGVCNHSFLENTAEAIRRKGFLGCHSLVAGTEEADGFSSLVSYVTRAQPFQPSIVLTSIASAVDGAFGDVHATRRTWGSTLFINPLMGIYWCYDVDTIAAMMGFAKALETTRDFQEIAAAILSHHRGHKSRPWVSLPL